MTQSAPAPIGLLLVNLGTPDAPDAGAVRRYLAEFLSDPRVVELPRLIWLPILYGAVLTTRPRKSAEAYERLWIPETNESPLRAITRRQSEKLAERAKSGVFGETPVIVDYAMRYGTPSLQGAVDGLMGWGCERILVMPLYPQYAAATTATLFDALAAVLRKMRKQPTLRFLPPYYADPAYIEALAESLSDELTKLKFEPEAILASFHGLPERQIDLGDPYKAQCETTCELLREATGYDAQRLRLSFQSRFGRTKWIEPYTVDTVVRLAEDGVKRLAVIAPGFSADCLETIDEIGVEIQDAFLKAGGEDFARIPCLNDGEAGMRLLESLARRELAGWL
jgi:ferrochelatase